MEPPASEDEFGAESYSCRGDLAQEAQDRARGEAQSRNFSQYQHFGGWGGRGGWGGGVRSYGGGGFRR